MNNLTPWSSSSSIESKYKFSPLTTSRVRWLVTTVLSISGMCLLIVNHWLVFDGFSIIAASLIMLSSSAVFLWLKFSFKANRRTNLLSPIFYCDSRGNLSNATQQRWRLTQGCIVAPWGCYLCFKPEQGSIDSGPTHGQWLFIDMLPKAQYRNLCRIVSFVQRK
ncbi:protein YgfX [Thalassotalea sp. PS06]|uniref:protein YgfX n=1 Tax=Thalassotalea sp. PS06 TaxID=2594005 RepID=UPI003918BE7B